MHQPAAIQGQPSAMLAERHSVALASEPEFGSDNELRHVAQSRTAPQCSFSANALLVCSNLLY